jgi:plasmid stability protein
MVLTINLADDLAAELKERAKKHQVSVEQLVNRILTDAMGSTEPLTPPEVVARVQATPPNSAHVRPATADLANLLIAVPGDPCFDLESWNRQWSEIEEEMKAITLANDIAEGRERSD